jgi:hypothetical protein|tara:strand:- start:41 stop:571 length:531 start_codon:yes stop_codon:yes gene_type:complete
LKIIPSLLLVLPFLVGCVHLTEPRYSPSRDNIKAMKIYEDAKVKALAFNQSESFDLTCRALGAIKPADNLTVAQFITNAFNDEFKLANIYSEDGVKISAEITNIEVSSFSGFWAITILISGHNNKTLSIKHKHEFKTAYFGDVACNRTASALTNAIQGLINKAISHPDFSKLLDLS